jgi:hypothetical protein
MDFTKREYYVNDQAELDQALKNATDFGYEYEPNSHKIDGESSGFFLKLSEKKLGRFGKCGSCGTLQSVVGIYSHGRKCENCGEVISLQYKKDDVLSFSFIDERYSMDRINLKIYKIDTETCSIWFYMNDLVDGKDLFGSYSGSSPEETIKKLEEFKHCYGIVQERDSDEKFYMFYNTVRGTINPLTKINICDSKHFDGTHSGMKNCKVVYIYDGKEYPEHGYKPEDKIPVMENFHIYKDWLVKKNMAHFLHKVGINIYADFYSGCGMSNIDNEKLSNLRSEIEKHKGVDAAYNFNLMMEDVDMTTSCIIKNLFHLERADYCWPKADKSEIKDDGISSRVLQNMLNMTKMFPDFKKVFDKFESK